MVALAQLFAGSMSVDMPPFLQAMNYLNPAQYTLRAMAQLTLPNRRFTCGEAQRQLDGQCIISTGEQVLDLYKLQGTGAISIAALAALTIGYRIVGWATLRIVRMNLDR